MTNLVKVRAQMIARLANEEFDKKFKYKE